MAYKKKFIRVLEHKIAYIEAGQGDPIVLVHGNPTSSYLWRNVVPGLTDLGRVIVPDLIGHGDSDKLPVEDGPLRYTFQVAYSYFSQFLTEIGADDSVTLVVHDWGSALGFHWAQEHPRETKAIAYMEAIVKPIASWDDWPEKAVGIFKGFRSDKGEDLVLDRNLFLEGVLPSSIIRNLTDDEMDNYRKPFLKREDRQTMLNWPRQIPIAGEPPEMVAVVESYSDWMSRSERLPKLFINADPGSILVGNQREFCRAWPNQLEVTVPGLHFLQEDSPAEIGKAFSNWYKALQR